MLVAGAEAIDAKQRMAGHGVKGDLRIDWPDLIRFKRSFTDPVPEKHERRYEKEGIVTLHGTAKFTGPDRLSVGDQEIEYRKILIASGARRSEEHTSELQSLMRISYAVFCLKTNKDIFTT